MQCKYVLVKPAVFLELGQEGLLVLEHLHTNTRHAGSYAVSYEYIESLDSKNILPFLFIVQLTTIEARPRQS